LPSIIPSIYFLCCAAALVLQQVYYPPASRVPSAPAGGSPSGAGWRPPPRAFRFAPAGALNRLFSLFANIFVQHFFSSASIVIIDEKQLAGRDNIDRNILVKI